MKKIRKKEKINPKRKCIYCNNKIETSMGFVLARDILNKKIIPRELCGKCGLTILEMNEEQLKKIFKAV